MVVKDAIYHFKTVESASQVDVAVVWWVHWHWCREKFTISASNVWKEEIYTIQYQHQKTKVVSDRKCHDISWKNVIKFFISTIFYANLNQWASVKFKIYWSRTMIFQEHKSGYWNRDDIFITFVIPVCSYGLSLRFDEFIMRSFKWSSEIPMQYP